MVSWPTLAAPVDSLLTATVIDAAKRAALDSSRYLLLLLNWFLTVFGSPRITRWPVPSVVKRVGTVAFRGPDRRVSRTATEE